MSTASIAVPEAFRYIFWGDRHHRVSRKEAVMDWARILAYVTGTVHQELLARNDGPLYRSVSLYPECHVASRRA